MHFHLARRRARISGPGLSANKLFVHCDQIGFFELPYVGGKVALGEIELFQQCVEVHWATSQGQIRHDGQPYPVHQ